DKFFKATGMRWSEFVRLPYFDAVRMTIIDPMHNLLIGVIKNHWYATWIQGSSLQSNTSKVKRELGLIHEYLNSMRLDGYIPAKQVGEPAGGSLSADTYKGLGTVFLPVVIPLVWDAFLDPATKDYNASLESFEKRMATWDLNEASQVIRQPLNKSKKVTEPPKPPERRMHPGEEWIFLKLATATKIYMQYELMREDMYSQSKMKPNHHYIMHLPDQIKDYGPVYGFWCFLGEQLNKLLKSFKSNNWGGGQLEVSMMREWGRDVQLHQTISGFFSLMPCWAYLQLTDVSCF
ncbi:hypothetical protein JB92DRAFT_2705186, partial [Gautieria morchelliformis]